MTTTSLGGPRRLELPFVGRTKEATQLRLLHAQRQHVLILGPPGVGKSALVARLRHEFPLLCCPHSEHLGEICQGLEAELGLDPDGAKLVERKQRLRQALGEASQTVVFDGVRWTTPKLSSFLETVMARVPVWLCACSEHPWDIGHFWRLLVRFARVEIRPFHLAQTRELVEAVVERGLVPPETRGIVEWLHRRAAGSPRVLRELFEELTTGHYDLTNPLALRRLDFDRRVHEILPNMRQVGDVEALKR
jgi:hypothetical protein